MFSYSLPFRPSSCDDFKLTVTPMNRAGNGTVKSIQLVTAVNVRGTLCVLCMHVGPHAVTLQCDYPNYISLQDLLFRTLLHAISPSKFTLRPLHLRPLLSQNVFGKQFRRITLAVNHTYYVNMCICMIINLFGYS